MGGAGKENPMLVTMKEILALCEKEGKAVGMFNATGLDSVQAIIEAAEEMNEPVILGHAEVHNVYNDIDFVAPLMIGAARHAKVPVAVHLDHGTSKEMVYRALRLGFTSIMIDASALPYEENLALTKELTDIAHTMGVSVEAELGRIVLPGGEHAPEDFYTDPSEAKDFARRTGIDALAIAFGTAHGFYRSAPKLDFDVVKKCHEATGLPLVMHGGSGVSPEGFTSAIESGIRKINYYSYMSQAGYMAAKKEIEEGNSHYLHDVEFKARLAMKEDVKKAIVVFAKKK